jgi:hypothetical protein
MVWTGSNWLRIETSGGLLWTRWWTFGFHNIFGSSWVSPHVAASEEGLSSMKLVNQLVTVCIFSSLSTEQNTRWIWSTQLNVIRVLTASVTVHHPSDRPLPPRRVSVIIHVRGWVHPRASVWVQGLGLLKNQMTSTGIKPATFRLVA